jgi:hypothetical protein
MDTRNPTATKKGPGRRHVQGYKKVNGKNKPTKSTKR